MSHTFHDMPALELDSEGLEALAQYFTPFELRRLVEDGAARAEREKIRAKARREFERQLYTIDKF